MKTKEDGFRSKAVLEEMEANGIPWKGIFGFDEARKQAVAGKIEETEALKKTLKTYMTKKAKQLGIPIDETLENGGFVDAPNDVMGFDFSEFYNCENSAACSVPPLDWDEDKDGDWVRRHDCERTIRNVAKHCF